MRKSIYFESCISDIVLVFLLNPYLTLWIHSRELSKTSISIRTDIINKRTTNLLEITLKDNGFARRSSLRRVNACMTEANTKVISTLVLMEFLVFRMYQQGTTSNKMRSKRTDLRHTKSR